MVAAITVYPLLSGWHWPARKVSGRPKRCKLAHAFPWEYRDKRLKVAQLLGQLGVSLTWSQDWASQKSRHFATCPGRKPPFLAVKHHARPCKSAIETRFT